MRLLSFLLFILITFISCQNNNVNKLAPVSSNKNLIDSVPLLVIQREPNDSIYKVGNYLFTGNKNLAFDFFQNGHRPNQLKSNGDTLYRDSFYTILADSKKADGTIYKKYIPKYRFEDYQVDKTYIGPYVKPNFSTDPRAREYRTAIRSQCLDSAINFAGHYTIAQWGCGMECLMMAVIDRTNGSIFYSTNYLPFDTADGHWGITYRKNSRLLIVNSYLLEDYPGYVMQQSWRKLSFYQWKGNGFVKLD